MISYLKWIHNLNDYIQLNPLLAQRFHLSTQFFQEQSNQREGTDNLEKKDPNLHVMK